MKLSEYFAGVYGKQAELAKSMGIAAPMLSQWASGDRPVPLARCLPIQAATGGKVMRWDLRPNDWHLIWPELIGTDGAPKIPTQTSEVVKVGPVAGQTFTRANGEMVEDQRATVIPVVEVAGVGLAPRRSTDKKA